LNDGIVAEDLSKVRDDFVSFSCHSRFRHSDNTADKTQRQPNNNKHVEKPAVIFIQGVESVG
tara:strand:- start:109 stop:294 length:186 start_codon:yes stop_codon:yes gene_type:complete